MAFNKNKETRLVEKKLQPLKVYIKFLFLLEKSERVQVKALVCKSVRPAPVVCVQGFKAGRTA